ncbi:MAG: S8 family serine peptidase [Patescibacteria group bacterium]
MDKQENTPQPPEHNSKWKLIVGIGTLVVLIVAGFWYYFTRREQPNISIPIRTAVDAYGRTPKAGEDYEPGVLLFRYDAGVFDDVDSAPDALAAVFKAYKAKNLSRPFANAASSAMASIYRVEIESHNVLAAMTELQKTRGVIFAEPSYLGKLDPLPRDPYFTSQGSWGNTYDDQWDMKIINMPPAWDITKGNSNVIVGVIDSGIDPTHPDLAGRVLEGYQLRNGVVTKGILGDCFDTHGTHVAGIIAAQHNDIGIAGVAPGVMVLPLSGKACPKIPPDTLGITGLYRLPSAGDIGLLTVGISDFLHLSIVNFSGNFGFRSQTVDEAFENLTAKGVLVVNSAGNDKSDSSLFSPSGTAGVFVVSATDQNDVIAPYSNYGSSIDVAAPGGDTSGNVLSLGSSQINLSLLKQVGSGYVRMSGTSMAAPHVAGLAALVKSIHPDWGKEKIECAIILGSDDMGDRGRDDLYGWGRINAVQTLLLTDAPVPCRALAKIDSPVVNAGVTGTVEIKGTAYAPKFVGYKVGYLPPSAPKEDTPELTWSKHAVVIEKKYAATYNETLATWDTANLPEGNYQVRLYVDGGEGDIARHEIPVYVYHKTLEPISSDTGVSSCSVIVTQEQAKRIFGNTYPYIYTKDEIVKLYKPLEQSYEEINSLDSLPFNDRSDLSDEELEKWEKTKEVCATHLNSYDLAEFSRDSAELTTYMAEYIKRSQAGDDSISNVDDARFNELAVKIAEQAPLPNLIVFVDEYGGEVDFHKTFLENYWRDIKADIDVGDSPASVTGPKTVILGSDFKITYFIGANNTPKSEISLTVAFFTFSNSKLYGIGAVYDGKNKITEEQILALLRQIKENLEKF